MAGSDVLVLDMIPTTVHVEPVGRLRAKRKRNDAGGKRGWERRHVESLHSSALQLDNTMRVDGK